MNPTALEKCNTLLIAALLALSVCGVASAQTCYTPYSWQPKLGGWVNDLNGNYVDDLIESFPTDTTIKVLLALNDCATTGDLQRIGGYGTITYRSPYLSMLVLAGVSRASAMLLGDDERVAMVFPNLQTQAFLDTSVAALRVSPTPDYSPMTIAEQHPELDGSGINIAVLDSGVDDGHETLEFSIVAGYDFTGGAPFNPNDNRGHGTHVAGIALGRGDAMGNRRGVAPGAGLIDMKIMDPLAGADVDWAVQAIDSCIARKDSWNIRVINASFGVDRDPRGNPVVSNGDDILSQAFNRAVQAGIVVVAAAGNSGLPILGWGPASDEAITVGACTDEGTYSRDDDQLGIFSSRGPRLADTDDLVGDEQKPDVTAPGTNFQPLVGDRGIESADFNSIHQYVRHWGTSMAAPHVAGLAALLLELNPQLRPRDIKQVLIRTADDRGAAGWDAGWGNGYVNGMAAVEVVANATADVGFQVHCWRAGLPLWWETPDLVPANERIVAGVQNTIQARVRNFGPLPAQGVQVKLGVYNYGNDMAAYDLCDITIADLAAGEDTVVTCDWIPKHSGQAPGSMHACLKADVIYAADPEMNNNCAQHNIEVLYPGENSGAAAQIHAGATEAVSGRDGGTSTAAGPPPATFTMQIGNPTGRFLSVEARDVAGQLAGSGWTLTPSIVGLAMSPGACPTTVTFRLTPSPGAIPRVRVALRVTGFAPGGGQFALGGASFVGTLEGVLDAPPAAPRLSLVVGPNPSRGPATIEMVLPTGGETSLGLYDVSGRRVRALHAGSAETGRHVLTWDGSDATGRRVAPGVYWVRLERGSESLTRTLLRLE